MKAFPDKQFKNLDDLIDTVENFKYTYEGPNRTAGSYMLTWLKSARTTSCKDPKMWEEICKFNENLCNSRYNDGLKHGIILSCMAITTIYIGAQIVNYMNDELEDENEKESK